MVATMLFIVRFGAEGPQLSLSSGPNYLPRLDGTGSPPASSPSVGTGRSTPPSPSSGGSPSGGGPASVAPLADSNDEGGAGSPMDPQAAAGSSPDDAYWSLSRDGAVVARGKSIYAMMCQACHGDTNNQAAGSPSNLYDSVWVHGGQPAEIEAVIVNGYLEKGMPPWKDAIPESDIQAVTAYLLSYQEPTPSHPASMDEPGE